MANRTNRTTRTNTSGYGRLKQPTPQRSVPPRAIFGLVLTVLDAKKPLQLQAANVLSWIAAVTFAYVCNRVFVFRSHSRNILREAAAFYSARLGTLLTEMIFMFLLVTVLGLNDKIIKLAMQFVVIALNYVFSKLFVFREDEER